MSGVRGKCGKSCVLILQNKHVRFLINGRKVYLFVFS